MTRILSAISLLMLVAYPASATSFWLSPYGTELGSTQPTSFGEVPTIYNFDTQNTGSVYVWAQTDIGETLKNWSLRVKSTNASVLSFTDSTVYNPDLFTANDVRWEYTTEPTSSSEISDDFNGFTLSTDPSNLGHGIGPSTPTDDPFYYGPNDGSGSWLMAKLDYSIDTPSGTTQLFLQIGALGLNNAGETSADTQVLFGHTGDTPFADAGTSNRHTDGSNLLDAEVQVLSEPDSDFDNDTFVTGADFIIWQQNNGTVGSGTQPNGDATGDGDIDEIDLAAWEFQFGDIIPLMGLETFTVPEPATWVLTCLALSGLLVIGRRSLSR